MAESLLPNAPEHPRRHWFSRCWTCVALFALCACGPSAPPPDAATSYVVLGTNGTVQGWAIFFAFNDSLSPADRLRVRTASPVGMGPRFFVTLKGRCADNRDLFAAAKRIAGAQGVAAIACTATSPDAR